MLPVHAVRGRWDRVLRAGHRAGLGEQARRAVDENWFSSDEVDLILVVQGQLKFEFESPGEPDRVLSVGEVLVLPAGERCRAYRWPRDAPEATVFVAAYPDVDVASPLA